MTGAWQGPGTSGVVHQEASPASLRREQLDWMGWRGAFPRAIHETEQWGESCLTPTAGSLVVKSVGPVTERLLERIPELTR